MTRPTWKRALLRIALIVSGLYLLTVIGLVLVENYLVYPVSRYPAGDWKAPDLRFEEVDFTAADGTRLVGWYLPAPAPNGELRPAETTPGSDQPPEPQPTSRPTRTILLCHGNAENVAQATRHLGDDLRRRLNANVLVFDYRGYGKSDGTPNEAGILLDAEAALQWLCDRTKNRPDQVILVGHSLGGGPATHLAWKSGARALVLQRTFGDLADPAAAQYWWVPVRLLMQNRFRSAEKIRRCDCPLFQSHGDRDRVVPIESGHRIFDNSPAKLKQFITRTGCGHYSPLDESYWQQLQQFIEQLESHPR